jgi:mono/diheme cytochrome c family protein
VDTNQIILAVVAAVLVVFSLTVALVVPRRNPDFPARKLGMFFTVAMGLVAGMLLTVVYFGEGDDEEVHAAPAAETEGGAPTETGAPPETGQPTESGPPPETGATGEPPAPAGDAAAGAEVFASAGCTSCHTLADAGASGTVGPNLDDAKPPYELVIDRVTNGAGAMPSFAGQLSEQQIQDVAAYVVQATGG